MATEKKTSAKNTTAKKTTAKKATCKAIAKCATKKTVKAAAPKHIGLVKNDPYLADFEPAIVGRHEHALWKLNQLTRNGKISLSDFANGGLPVKTAAFQPSKCSRNFWPSNAYVSRSRS